MNHWNQNPNVICTNLAWASTTLSVCFKSRPLISSFHIEYPLPPRFWCSEESFNVKCMSQDLDDLVTNFLCRNDDKFDNLQNNRFGASAFIRELACELGIMFVCFCLLLCLRTGLEGGEMWGSCSKSRLHSPRSVIGRILRKNDLFLTWKVLIFLISLSPSWPPLQTWSSTDCRCKPNAYYGMIPLESEKWELKYMVIMNSSGYHLSLKDQHLCAGVKKSFLHFIKHRRNLRIWTHALLVPTWTT